MLNLFTHWQIIFKSHLQYTTAPKIYCNYLSLKHFFFLSFSLSFLCLSLSFFSFFFFFSSFFTQALVGTYNPPASASEWWDL
jgi:hypothetical protein